MVSNLASFGIGAGIGAGLNLLEVCSDCRSLDLDDDLSGPCIGYALTTLLTGAVGGIIGWVINASFISITEGKRCYETGSCDSDEYANVAAYAIPMVLLAGSLINRYCCGGNQTDIGQAEDSGRSSKPKKDFSQRTVSHNTHNKDKKARRRNN